MARSLFTVLILSLAVPAAGQKPPETGKARVPGKGDTVIARGCLSGATLRASETKLADGDGSLGSPVTYRLTGPRGLLRSIRDEHDGEIVELEGVLKSDIEDVARGKPIGKSGIRIGMGPPPRGNSPGDSTPYYPVLDVKSFESATGRCVS